MKTISKEAAQEAAKAINDYLSSWRRKGSGLEGACVETLEILEGKQGTLWLAHLAVYRTSTFTAHVFMIDGGRARPMPGYRFNAAELFPHEWAEKAMPMRTLTEPPQTPATALLAETIEAVERHYAATAFPLEQVFALLWSALKEAVRRNDERGCTEMLLYLHTALESTGIAQLPEIAPLTVRMEAIIAQASFA